MELNKAYPIRITITINWKEKYKDIKKEFEKALKNYGYNYPEENKRKKILKTLLGQDTLYPKYDFIGEITDTSHASILIKDNAGDNLTTHFDVFNNREHIKNHITMIKNLLKRTIKNNKKHYIKLFIYKWTEYVALNDVIFTKNSFKETMKENSYIFLGWFAIPLANTLSIYSKTKRNINESNFENSGIVKTIKEIINSINTEETILSLLILGAIFLFICYIKYNKKQNVIRF